MWGQLAALAGGYLLSKIGDDDDEGGESPYEGLRLDFTQAPDPLTQARQQHLYNQTQGYAQTSPFQAQFGGPQAMPGLSGMSQAGQQYLANQILGPGAYATPETGFNLGFTPYALPTEGYGAGQMWPSPQWAYSPRGETVDDVTPTYPGSGSGSGDGSGDVTITDPRQLPPSQGGGGNNLALSKDEFSKGGDYSTQPYQPPRQDGTIPPYYPPGFVPTFPVTADDPTPAASLLGTRAEEDAARASAGMAPFSPTVGVRDIEEGAEATRRMLMQTAPSDPAYSTVTAGNIGQTTVSPETFDEDLDYRIGAPDTTSVDGITGVTTGGLEAFNPATFAGVEDVTVNPFDAATTTSVDDVAPEDFTGASFLSGNLGAYMDQLGVDAQVEQARYDYQRAMNEEQARRAGSHAWGTRGDIPRAEQEAQMLRRVADIRRQGFTDAADRLEADLQRQQAAGLQSQQLAAQTGLAGQQLEAQRRQSDAARLQDSLAQQQQLETQAAMQTQQLSQAGGIRGAEFTQQSRLQQQMLEAERRQQDAAREQQARIQGQDIAARLGLQSQQLGTQVDIQNAQNTLRAAEIELNAAVQAGDREAVLDAQRKIRNAELGLDATVRNQQAGLTASGMGLDARQAFRNQQLAAASQLADLGGMRQGAAFGAADALRQMGADQEQAQRLQQAFAYDQWLRGQEGGAESLALLQAMQPGAATQQYRRAPSQFGQIFGGLVQGAGAAAGLKNAFG